MMFCCFAVPTSVYAPIDTPKYMVSTKKYAHPSLLTSPSGGSTQPTTPSSNSSWSSALGEYPAMRRGDGNADPGGVVASFSSLDQNGMDDCIRLIPTFGNARREYDPLRDDLISVTVPPDTFPGQVIGVVHPSGSGRIAATAVPQGLAPGDTFTVCFPANAAEGSQRTTPIPWSIEGGIPTTTGRQASTTEWKGANTTHIDHELALRESVDETRGDPSAKVQRHDKKEENEAGNDDHEEQSEEDGRRNETQPLVSETAKEDPPPAPPSSSGLLLVNVPHGASAGSRLHVAVPNEPGRVLEAVVPPGNVQQFHLSYQPQNHAGEACQHQQARPHTDLKKSHCPPTPSTAVANSNARQRQDQNWQDPPAGYAAPMIMLPGFV